MALDVLDQLYPPHPPGPARLLWPARNRPELLVDCQGAQLVDADNNFIGFDTDWGLSGPPARRLAVRRDLTRGL